MCDTSEIILRGPPMPTKIFQGTLGEYLFSRMKIRDRTAIAQVVGETGISSTLGELFTQSIQVAENLRNLGLKQGDVVAFTCRNVQHCFAAAMGAVWNGCVIAPVDPALKTLELKYLFNFFKPSLVFSQQDSVKSVQEALDLLDNKSSIIIIDSLNTEISGPYPAVQTLFNIDVDVDSFVPSSCSDPNSELAVIVTSSGSTGLPKGVGLTHYNVIFQLSAWDHLHDMFATQVFLQLTQFFWISGVFTYFNGAMLGTKRVIVRQFDEVGVMKAIDQHKATMLFLSPAELSSLVKHPDFHKYDLSSIQAFIAGGAPLPKSVYTRVKELLGPHVNCTQGYGMTEIGGGITFPPPEDKVEAVGKLFLDISMKVVDINTGKSLGPNQQGEFCYKSPGMMKGYVRNPEATAEAIDKDGWLHSGDLGYYDEEGYLYIVDRIKEFIKYRTWQVPPVEVESLLIELPGIRDVGVAGVPNDEDIYHPTALVVLEPNATITEKEIVDYVADKLSDPKRLRGGVKFVDQIPRTPTGKIKRPALKELAKKLSCGL